MKRKKLLQSSYFTETKYIFIENIILKGEPILKSGNFLIKTYLHNRLYLLNAAV